MIWKDASKSGHYTRIPEEVLTDGFLKDSDVRVYGVIASFCWQGNIVSIGTREIAKQAHVAKRLVGDSLRRLESRGHIQKFPAGRGKRGTYELLSLVFGKKQRAGYEDLIMDASGNRRLATARQDQFVPYARLQSPSR